MSNEQKRKKLFDEICSKKKKMRFERICTIIEAFGFSRREGKGSHTIFFRKDLGVLLNFQNVGGRAKPYQVKQFIKVVEQYGLIEEGTQDEE